MRPLAIIPARAGSRRLPNKNLLMIDGKSLAALAIDQAVSSMAFMGREVRPMVIVSTDIRPGIETEHAYYHLERPARLADDATPMIDVVRHALGFAEELKMDFDSVVLLQPTSPLRTREDISMVLQVLQESGGHAVISVVRTTDPEVYTLGHAGRLRPVKDHLDGRTMMVPNGAVYAITREALRNGFDWWTAPAVYSYEMPADRSVDIDTSVDLEKARALWALHRQR